MIWMSPTRHFQHLQRRIHSFPVRSFASFCQKKKGAARVTTSLSWCFFALIFYTPRKFERMSTKNQWLESMDFFLLKNSPFLGDMWILFGVEMIWVNSDMMSCVFWFVFLCLVWLVVILITAEWWVWKNFPQMWKCYLLGGSSLVPSS